METTEFSQKSLALELNLSVATVSKSLRNHPDINPATRARVLELAARRGYQPALRAVKSAGPERGRGRSKSRFVGVLFYDRVGPSGVDASGTGYLAGLSDAARAYNVSLVVHRFGGESRQLLNPDYQPAAMREGFLDGLILIHHFESDVVNALAGQYSVVTITHAVYGEPVDHVDVNHAGAIAKLADHLYGLGHRRFGFLGRLPELAYNQARFGSFAASMARLGLPLDPAALVNVFTPIEDLDAVADRVAEQIRAGVTAWMGVSDFVAYDLWTRLERRGVRVPEDASLTGFDGMTPLFNRPQLATARAPFADMGAAALTRLLTRIENPVRPARQTLLECEQIQGLSTAPAPAGAVIP
ncbi:MAG: LacI family DNA-binding transcriptional regulator [Tepidisphaeraceae bacterium]